MLPISIGFLKNPFVIPTGLRTFTGMGSLASSIISSIRIQPTIRLSALISRDISNRMMAGRCVSSDRETNSALRVKANCMAMGEAAGTAAAIAVQENYDLSDIPLNVLKEKLEKNGAIIPGGERSFEELFSKN